MQTGPRLVGRYRLQAPLGAGGEGQVWRAIPVGGDDAVAIKFLTAHRVRRRSAEAALHAEIRAAAAIDHPHVVRLFDYGTAPEGLARIPPGAPWVAMELAPGGSLADHAAFLDWPSLRTALIQVLSALAAVHARGLLHRDVKPGNILLKGGLKPPDIRLADFGLASWRAGSGAGTDGPVEAIGTPRYMAPEQLSGDWRALGPWTDLFAVGCLGWTLVTGRPPAMESDPGALLAARHQPLPAFRPALAVPPAIASWLRGLLAPNIPNRTRFAADALAALEAMPERGGGPRMLRGGVIMQTPTQPTAQAAAVPPAPPVLPAPTSARPTPARGAPSGPSPLPIPAAPPVVPPPIVPPLGVRTSAPRAIICGAQPPPMPVVEAALASRTHTAGVPRGALAGLLRLPLVGREGVQRGLWSALSDVARTGRAAAVILEGPAGVGKSRLAEWLSERAHELGAAEVMRLLHGDVPGAEDGVLAAFTRQFACRGLDPAGAERHLERVLPELDRRDRAQFASLLGAQGLANAGGTQARFRLVERALSTMARSRPIILWCDDAARSSDTLGLVHDLLTHGRHIPLLAILTARTDEPRADDEATMLDAIAGHPHGSRVALGALAAEDAVALVQSMVPVADELAARIAQACSHQPILIEQTVRDWVVRGLTHTAPTNAALPADPDAVWAARLRALVDAHGPQSQTALELAAALGETVDGEEWTTACAAAGISSVAALVDDLVRRGLARADGQQLSTMQMTAMSAGAMGGWSFSHGLLREHLRLTARKEGRWASTADLCAKTLRASANPNDMPRIGRLEAESGDATTAANTLVHAAARLVAIGESPRAIRLLLETDLVIAQGGVGGDAPIEAQVLRAHALCNVGDLAGAEHAALSALEDAVDSGSGRLRACARRELGRIAWYQGDLPRAVVRLRRARDAAEHLGETYLQARTEVDLANALLPTGAFDEAEMRLTHAIKVFRGAGDPEGLARALLAAGELRRQQRRWAAGVTVLQRGLDALDGLPIHPLRARLLHNLGEIHRSSGAHEQAAQLYAEAEASFERVGDENAVWFARMNQGLIAMRRGERIKARETLEAVASLDATRGLRLIQAVSHAALVTLDAEAGDGDGVSHHLDELETILEGTGYVDLDLALMTRWAMLASAPWPHLQARLEVISSAQRVRLA